MAANQEQQAPARAERSLKSLILNPYVMLALAGLTWSGNHIAGRASTGHIPPVTLACVRWLIGAAVLWPFVHEQVKTDWPAIRRGWKATLLLCIAGGAAFTSIQFTALNYTMALNASIFNSFAPAMIAAAGALLFRDRLPAMAWFGLAVSFIGVMTIVSQGDVSRLLSVQFNYGDVLLLLNMTIWALYCAFLRMRPPVQPMTFVFLIALVGGVTLIPFAAWELSRGASVEFSLRSAVIVGYVALFSGLLGYVFWNRGQEAIGAARAGIFLHLIPFYGAVLATTLLGEHLRLFHVVGCALILGGVWIASRK